MSKSNRPTEKNKYQIGTRGSLLAVTQCTLIKNEMSEKTGKDFNLNLIKTQGDLQTDKPLWQLDGKDFFTKELDTALLNDGVDLVVHSYKDLGSDRPDGIGLATITERKFAQDILLIKKETLAQIKDKKEFIVGTSSPRRIVNIESSLADFLPSFSEEGTVKCEMLRGNVNTRIQKLRDGNYDAIVLALAGLERLALGEKSIIELKTLLKDLTFMVMPQSVFPSSASQGALAIEYNKNRDDQELYNTLRSVHCEKTESEIKREREAFKKFGGGCHLAVGIHVKSHKGLYLNFQKGEYDGNKILKTEVEGVDYSPLKGLKPYIVMGEADPLVEKVILEKDLSDSKNYFVTSKHCLDGLQNLSDSTFWSAGTCTSKKMAKMGLWTCGSAEGFGHQEIVKIRESKAVAIMLTNSDWVTLSHDQAESPVGPVTACYTRKLNDITEDSIADLLNADIIYWYSLHQFESYTKRFPVLLDKKHSCGLGKTYDALKEADIELYPVYKAGQLEELV